MLSSVKFNLEGRDMKKIFASILALVAFASCSNDINDVVVNATKFVAPMEISVAESRAFDADLNWAWESSDVIAAYQNAGAKSVNQLALNAAGNFYNAAFEYATQELSQFHFVYPASQLASDYSLTAAQTGVWTPVLYGTVEAATVTNLGTVEMNYLSSAFEVRVWESGRAARKNIVKAVLSSANDFVPTWNVNNDLTYTQTLSGKELSIELNSDTAIFNLGEGDFVFNLTLTDANGKSANYVLPAKNFVAGKRTILNVEWFDGAAAVNSWYEDYANNGSSNLEGGAIYVTTEGGDAVVTVNGTEVTVVDGKISGLATGTYDVVVNIKGHELVNRSVVVTPIPSISATISSSYSKNGVASPTNSISGTELQVLASLNESIPSNLISSAQVVYGSTTSNISLGNVSKFNLALGEYKCSAKVTLANGYVCSSPVYVTHITGLPYTLNVASNDGTWTGAGNVAWNTAGGVQLGYYQWGDAASITRTFHIPAALTVKVSASGTVAGTGSWIKVDNTATVTVGSTTVVSSTKKGNGDQSWSCSSASASMSSSSNSVKVNSSYNLEQARVVLKSLSIQY